MSAPLLLRSAQVPTRSGPSGVSVMNEHTESGDLGTRFQQFFELLPAFDDASLDQVFPVAA